MRYLPMRRSKLTSSEGPGSLVINPDGETLLVGALDQWFQQTDEFGTPNLDREFLVEEPRLRTLLNVDAFYQPPDYRQHKRHAEMALANMNLVIPLYRFPTWHYCSKCQKMKQLKLDTTSPFEKCENCEGAKRYFKQVPFVTICNEGHINEFPWVEWTHETSNATCKGLLTLKMSGGTTLDTWQTVCTCGAKRSLKGITGIDKNTKEPTLGKILNKNSAIKYTCAGNRPWCGTVEEEKETGNCSEMPLAILRNSINIYMPKRMSAIHIPEKFSKNEQQVIDFFKANLNVLEALQGIKENESILLQMMKSLLDMKISIEDSEYLNAFHYCSTGETGKETIESEQLANNIRHDEFEKLKTDVLFNREDLVIEPVWRHEEKEKDKMHSYKRYLQRVSKVNRLKETTVLYGFDRREVKITDDYQTDIKKLYKNVETQEKVWLPASITYGEGIFVEFNKTALRKWEKQESVRKYYNSYVKRVEHVPHRDPLIIASPRNIMIHTLAHFLIEQFGEVSGYAAPSIRERLYLEEHQSGFLIYTSSGDSEGTFGGLLKLANEEEFFRYFDIAISKASWCSSDPVCTELGQEYGQGIDSLNGAACYNCSHVPETSCEFINRYLDRTLLIDEKVGYFSFLKNKIEP